MSQDDDAALAGPSTRPAAQDSSEERVEERQQHPAEQRHTAEEHRASEAHLEESLHEVWYLKEISFRASPDESPKHVKVITQNFNGPCSFIAICNVLILRGLIQILPYDRPSVSYDFLSQLLAEYLLTACPDVDISAALSAMPATRKGMDLNPLFTGPKLFRPAGSGGELKLFEQAGIELVHGWLVDPSAPEHRVLSRTEDYDSSVNLLVEADHVAQGQLVVSETEAPPVAGPSSASSSSRAPAPAQAGPSNASLGFRTLTSDQQQKIEDALHIRSFLDGAPSQLTYYGLFTLASTLPPGALVAHFRNSHLSVLHKAHGEDGALYTLVTDQVFLHERSIVWERLEDVDGRWSTFVDSDFVKSSPAGGDYAGHTGESALRALEQETGALSLGDSTDEQLARQLQAEEDERAHAIYSRREKERIEREARRARDEHEERERSQRSGESERRKKKGDCLIM